MQDFSILSGTLDTRVKPGSVFQEENVEDSIDAIVKRNIEEAVRSANLGNLNLEGPPSTSEWQPSSRSNSAGPSHKPLGRLSSAGNRKQLEHLEAPLAVPYSGPDISLGTVGAASSTSVLDVPGHAEATIRLHKTRIKGLEEELSKLSQALSERDKQLAEVKKENKTLKLEQSSWAKTQKALDAQIEKLKRTAAEAEAAAATRELALKEAGRFEKEKRISEAETRTRDVRLQRALEEVEKYKGMISDLRAQEREGKDVAKSDYSKVLTDNKRLERQRAELLILFKKQLKLIDVLKRQKLHLEVSRALQFTEQEFLQTLEMGSA
ncbi:hypothetical protein CEUSTIGMA_g3357.t1 [Chlamydomonas eustigma]|uniref:Testis expressed 9 n=1 Tax=Chlamydomonas eustigma TaxID=1157962 RepID=A0A250WYJ3_9CHLO|nr:hypothetical protein CEUSTIGMA_g3357.t1 [Chlamydomonas eustigma]|eukprot:GAX75914.1 hypothetical protein CEUSTIGMA_g3357.t1 [Chlamydomonas eustigma]